MKEEQVTISEASTNTAVARTPCPLQALPPGLQSFCSALALEGGLPPGAVAAVCLWTLMRAAVPGSRLYSAGLEMPINDGADALLLVHEGPTVPGALLDMILHPVLDAQSALVDAYERLDANNLALREAQLRRMQDQMVSRDRFPDAAHLDFLRVELDRIQAQRRPLLLLKDPSPRQLDDAPPYFLDNAPAVVLTDASSNQELLQRVGRLQAESPTPASKHGPAACVAPLSDSTVRTLHSRDSQLSLLCCCDTDYVDELLSRWSWLFRNCFLLNIGATTVDGTQRPATDLEPWNALVRQALAPRIARSHTAWQLTQKATEALHAGVDALAGSQPTDSFAYSADAIKGMSGRLALALHASLPPPGTNLTHETVECALAQLRWLIAERQRSMQICHAKTQGKRDAAAEAAMLEKIASRGGRLRRRELFRLYDQHRKNVHDPVLERLLQKDAVFVDDAGFVCLTDQLDHEAFPQRTSLRTY